MPTGPPSQASVTVTASSPVVLLGSTLQLAVIVKDASGAVVTDPKVAFSSSSPPIAVVSAAGVVTGVSLGIATISATAEGLSGKLDVTVMVPYESGGSNYPFYSMGTELSNPTPANWYAPLNLRPVIGTYHLDSTTVQQQLATMYANGQRKVSLNLWYTDLGPLGPDVYGHEVNAHSGHLLPQHLTNLKSVLAAIQRTGFNEVILRFDTQWILDPSDPAWVDSSSKDPAWVDSSYNIVWSFVSSTIRQAEAAKENLDLLYDLDGEKGGLEVGQARAYTRRLWKDYLSQFPVENSFGFSIAGAAPSSTTIGADRLTSLIADFDAVGTRPNVYADDIYDNELEALASFYQALAAAHEQHKLVIFNEGYYNDSITAAAIKRARNELHMNIRFIMQWPWGRNTQPSGSFGCCFSVDYAAEYSAYRTP